jgi:hypothetical protein
MKDLENLDKPAVVVADPRGQPQNTIAFGPPKEVRPMERTQNF